MLDRIREAWRSEPGALWTALTLGAAVLWTWALWVSIAVVTTTDDPYAGLLLLLTIPVGTGTFLWLLAHWRRSARHWDEARDGQRQAWAAVVAVPVVVGSLWGGVTIANGVHDLRVDRSRTSMMRDLANIEREAADEVRDDPGTTIDDLHRVRVSLYEPNGTEVDPFLATGAARWGFDRVALVDVDGDGTTDEVLAHQPGLIHVCAEVGDRGTTFGHMVPEPEYRIGGAACGGTIVALWTLDG